jgi:hypothetical protein
VRLVDAAALLVAVAELSALPQLSETPVQSQNTPLPPSCRLVSFIIPGDRRTLRPPRANLSGYLCGPRGAEPSLETVVEVSAGGPRRN